MPLFSLSFCSYPPKHAFLPENFGTKFIVISVFKQQLFWLLTIMLLSKPVQLSLPPTANQSQLKCLQKQFLNDPSADLFIILGEQIFPVHRKHLSKSKKISSLLSSEKFLIVDQNLLLDVKSFEKILMLFYGVNVEIKHFSELEKVLPIIEYLEMEDLKEEIETLLTVEVDQYDIFVLFNFAYKLSLNKVIQACIEQLKRDNFEQMMYNKFDLVHSDFHLFQIVLRIHQVLKQKEEIEGLGDDQIEETIQLYCKTQQFNEETKSKLLAKYGRKLTPKEDPFQRENPLVKIHQIPESKEDSVIHVEEDVLYPSYELPTQYKKEGKQPKESTKISYKLKEKSTKENNITRNRKFSHQVENKFYDFDLNSFREKIDEPVSQKIFSLGQGHFQPFKVEDDAEEIASKISTLLGEYQNAYQLHDNNLQKVKKKSQVIKSMIFEEKTESYFGLQKHELIGTSGERTKGNEGYVFKNLANSVYKTENVEEGQITKQNIKHQ